MTEFFPEIMVREEEAEAIARGLYTVALADGAVHPRELALISEYYAATSDNPSDFAALERSGPIEAEILASLLGRPEVRDLFLKTALLMAYADGSFGKGERESIQRFAAAMNIDAATLEAMDTQVREYLMSQLAHLANVDAVVEVAKELKH